MRRAQNRVVGGDVAVLGARDAEVHHLDVAVLLNHDVLRLDVTVNDVVLVRDGQRLRNLRANLGNLLRVECPMTADAALEVDAAQVLHDDVIGVAVLAPVVHRDDVRALQGRGRLSLLLEAGGKGLVSSILRKHGLDGHRAAEDLVHAAVNGRHASRADLVLDCVASP